MQYFLLSFISKELFKNMYYSFIILIYLRRFLAIQQLSGGRVPHWLQNLLQLLWRWLKHEHRAIPGYRQFRKHAHKLHELRSRNLIAELSVVLQVSSLELRRSFAACQAAQWLGQYLKRSINK